MWTVKIQTCKDDYLAGSCLIFQPGALSISALNRQDELFTMIVRY